MLEKLVIKFGTLWQYLFALCLALIVVLLIAKVVVPVCNLFKMSLKMIKISSSPRGHWFFGHLKKVRPKDYNMYKKIFR